MKNLCLLILTLAVAVPAEGQVYSPAGDTAWLVKKIREKASETFSIMADFTEEKHSAFFVEPKRSQGKFYYEKGNKMRWEKLPPGSFVFISRGTDTRLMENGKVHSPETTGLLAEGIRRLMSGLVDGSFTRQKEFSASYFKGEGFYMVQLVPRQARLARSIEKIELLLSENELRLKKMSVFEKQNKGKTITEFHHEKFNSEIDDQLFEQF